MQVPQGITSTWSVYLTTLIVGQPLEVLQVSKISDALVFTVHKHQYAGKQHRFAVDHEFATFSRGTISRLALHQY